MQGGKLYLPIGLRSASLTIAFLRRDMRICEDATPKMGWDNICIFTVPPYVILKLKNLYLQMTWYNV